MSQFRIPGDYYVSQFGGDDLNAGTDPDLPLATFGGTPDSLTNKIILGAGWYKELPINQKYLVSDGNVVVDFQNFSGILPPVRCEGMRIKNLRDISSTSAKFHNCIIEDFDGGISVYFISSNDNGIRNNIFLGKCGFQPHSLTWVRIYNNCFIGPSVNYDTLDNRKVRWSTFQFNYVDYNTILYLANAADLPAVSNNCINGPIQNTDGTQYEVKFLEDGNIREDANPLLDDISVLDPDFYTRNNFAGDPKFIDLLSRTVEPSSPLLKLVGTFGTPGSVKAGKSIGLSESGFTITKTNIDDSNPNSWKISGGAGYAKVRITGKVSDSLISAQALDIRIPFFFDGSEVGGTTDNNNVPDAWNARTTADTKGELPNRLTFEIRSSILANPGRDTAADWDNGDAGIPGNYYLMEWGQPLMHHIDAGVAYGNADANAINAPTIQPFNYRSLDIIITITNTREI